jgi:hypothetical protein
MNRHEIAFDGPLRENFSARAQTGPVFQLKADFDENALAKAVREKHPKACSSLLTPLDGRR